MPSPRSENRRPRPRSWSCPWLPPIPRPQTRWSWARPPWSRRAAPRRRVNWRPRWPGSSRASPRARRLSAVGDREIACGLFGRLAARASAEARDPRQQAVGADFGELAALEDHGVRVVEERPREAELVARDM